MPSSVTDQLYLAEDSPSGMRWKYAGARRKAGDVAGSRAADGYWNVCVNYKRRPAHHAVWFLHYGVWPSRLDHRDGDRSNNAIGNLRTATHPENMRNRLMPARTLPQGVSKSRNKFRGCVEIHGVKHRKTFETVDAAAEWVQHKRATLHGEFALESRNTVENRNAQFSN